MGRESAGEHGEICRGGAQDGCDGINRQWLIESRPRRSGVTCRSRRHVLFDYKMKQLWPSLLAVIWHWSAAGPGGVDAQNFSSAAARKRPMQSDFQAGQNRPPAQ